MKFDPENPLWTAYALGEVAPASRAEFDREVESNPEARAFVESIRATASELRTVLAQEPALTLRPEQRRALAQRAAEKPVIVFPLRPLFAIGLAAGLVALIGVGLFRMKPEELLVAKNEAKIEVMVVEPEVVELEEFEKEFEMLPDLGEMVDMSMPAELSAMEAPVVLDAPAFRDGRQEPAALHMEGAAPSAPPVDKRGMDVAQLNVMNDSSPLVMKGLFAGRSAGGRASRLMGNMPDIPPPESAAAPARPQVLYRSVVGSVRVNEESSDRIDSNFLSPSLDDFDAVRENPFQRVADHPLSTFSIDVDSASYAVVRKFLNEGRLPPKDAVRIEELVNYFTYDYPQPVDGHPFAVHLAAAPAPWNPAHHLVRVALKARNIDRAERPPVNLVFLVDVSGSMSPPNRLPLVKRSLQALAKQLDERDRIAIVVYAGAAGLALPSTSGAQRQTIIEALDRLNAGGSTAGGAGIQLAYDTARAQFVAGGVNRVILCTDGDFNVGLTQRGDLERLIEEQAKSGVYLTVLGFGMGNYKDSTLELLSNKGNGNYGYIDDFSEARRLLVDQMLGTLVTVAKDVKIQVEFNPARVAGYRLIGYENRMLKKEDFNNDKVDAGDVGAGHTVTAFYEVIPAGRPVPGAGEVDALKYQTDHADPSDATDDLLTAKLRYKAPDGETSTKLEFPLSAASVRSAESSRDFRFGAAVAGFGLLLRESPSLGEFGYADVMRLAESDLGADPGGNRREFLNLVRNAGALGQ
ncbi:MAG TPA: von Willebrand factor type A domain-containing protein [Kiritimatiellia bacterium]|nr:von Willebrand factor type A domain-containing protein [Kiritimatiellia bacterium]